MRIISASRRADIPAFQAEWFADCVNQGFVKWRNPFGGQELETSLLPEDVAAIVFWSKDYGPLLPHLPGLYERGYRFVFHFTITGLPNLFEPCVPPVETAIRLARLLADEYGREAVLWRYDPVLVSTITTPDYHRNRISELAYALDGSCCRCYISFPTFYGKVERRLAGLRQQTGIECIKLPVEEKIALAHDLAQITASHGIEMLSCCGDYLVSDLIAKARCVDAELLLKLYPEREFALKHRGTREECGCFESVDIGTYGACKHGCIYCYANR